MRWNLFQGHVDKEDSVEVFAVGLYDVVSLTCEMGSAGWVRM